MPCCAVLCRALIRTSMPLRLTTHYTHGKDRPSFAKKCHRPAFVPHCQQQGRPGGQGAVGRKSWPSRGRRLQPPLPHRRVGTHRHKRSGGPSAPVCQDMGTVRAAGVRWQRTAKNVAYRQHAHLCSETSASRGPRHTAHLGVHRQRIVDHRAPTLAQASGVDDILVGVGACSKLETQRPIGATTAGRPACWVEQTSQKSDNVSRDHHCPVPVVLSVHSSWRHVHLLKGPASWNDRRRSPPSGTFALFSTPFLNNPGTNPGNPVWKAFQATSLI